MVNERARASKLVKILVAAALAVAINGVSVGADHWGLVTSAHAQGDSGGITGYIFDQAGNPLSGVKVTATSPTEMGGAKRVYTNAEGMFRFPVLTPGEFKVKAEAPRLQTVVQNNIKVGITSPAEVNLIMEVASTKVEEVKVVAKAPLVNTTKPNVKEVFDVDFVDQMPHDNRDVIFQQITNDVAGAIKGGRVRGGGGKQTIYVMDGFNMLNQYPTVKASSAYEIQTAAYGADNATAPGSVVNLVTRSGSNKFEFELGATADSSKLNFFQDATDPKSSSHFFVLNPTISGPIIKDKLWYSLNVEFLTRKTGREEDPSGLEDLHIDPEIRHWFKGTVKLAWQVTGRNKLQSVTNFDEFWQFNRTASGVTPDAQTQFESHNHFSGLIWESLLTDNLVFRSQVGVSNSEKYAWPVRCNDDPDTCDFIAPIKQNNLGGIGKSVTSGNAILHQRSKTYSFQFINRLEWFAATQSLGEHHLTLKNWFMVQGDESKDSVPGDMITEKNGAAFESQTTYFSNDPRNEPARYGYYNTQYSSKRNSLSLSDQWRPTRYLTVTPGVAFTTASASNSSDPNPLVDASALTPNLSVAWDATHDGRSVLRASFNQYVDVDLSPIANHTLGGQVSRKCLWNAATQAFDDSNCTYSGGRSGATVGLPCGPTGVDEFGQNCRQKLVLPKTWEYTIGAEREVMEGLSFALDGIYRKFVNQFEKLETNQIWNKGGNALASGGGFRNGKNQTISDLETPDNAYRRYLGVTGSVTRREGRLKLQASYTWSKLNGTVLEGFNNAYGDIGPRDIFLDGPLPDDHRHEVKVNFAYRFTPWLSTSWRTSYYSGLPYSRRFRNDQTTKYDDQKARIGVNPGVDINNPEDDREARLPDIMNVNAQLAVNFMPLIGQNLEVFADALNVLGLRTTNTVEENDGPSFGTTTQGGRELGLRVRFGMRYRY
jgi:phage gpG-like protein